MSLAASRAVLRHSTFAVRRAGIRNASSTSEAAGAAKDKAAEASSKASEGLSKVSSSAGNALSKAGSAASAAAGALSKVGGRTGRLVNTVQALIPRVTYYSRVGLELGKLVAHQRGMAPPNAATFQSYYQSLLKSLRNPGALFNQSANAAQPTSILSRVRNVSRTEVLTASIVLAEVLGFFTVGEMIGRFKIVGYRASAPAHH
ncbi:hypothetical protein BS50DRAFT_573863 [Corynespora cassiicola Philippines]|uniref:Mitochondrial F1F0-ATP synthase-like protein g subunit n=1 Tax=Corynespora cassiicola Philippines TaxID=1448308 RepID=A0A2T2NP01_CORCC|nr:hypothetical protein BS50DRAFT_573863 [Corynespora cassiicola Philippines]